MTDRDDATLVRDEINRCLTAAAIRLHPRDQPRAGEIFPMHAFAQAQYFHLRASVLQAMDTADAADYLRTETLTALAEGKTHRD